MKKVALVTGSSRGIGAATAALLAENGYAVCINYIERRDKAEELAGDRLEYVQCSRLQWRYIRLMLHPNQEEALTFISDVTAAGIAWGEGNLQTLPADADLSKPPHQWFTFDWWL